MAKSKQQPAKTPKPIEVEGKQGEEPAISVAKAAMTPAIRAGITSREFTKEFGDVEPADLIASLAEQVKLARSNSERAQEMLVAQAHTLDAIFNNLAQRANRSDYLSQFEAYLKLSLKAQAQSRATWDTWSSIQHPPVAHYVGQANIAHGHQQVNNNTEGAMEKMQKRPNELLEKQDASDWMDGRASSATSRADQELETVGAVNRAED